MNATMPSHLPQTPNHEELSQLLPSQWGMGHGAPLWPLPVVRTCGHQHWQCMVRKAASWKTITTLDHSAEILIHMTLRLPVDDWDMCRYCCWAFSVQLGTRRAGADFQDLLVQVEYFHSGNLLDSIWQPWRVAWLLKTVFLGGGLP